MLILNSNYCYSRAIHVLLIRRLSYNQENDLPGHGGEAADVPCYQKGRRRTQEQQTRGVRHHPGCNPWTQGSEQHSRRWVRTSRCCVWRQRKGEGQRVSSSSETETSLKSRALLMLCLLDCPEDKCLLIPHAPFSLILVLNNCWTPFLALASRSHWLHNAWLLLCVWSSSSTRIWGHTNSHWSIC